MSIKDIVHIALFAAITAALGVFPPFVLPLIGVPITAQSMGPMLAGSILGARKGALSMALFLLLVAIGLPLLAGGNGGLAVFLGPTAGFLFGWVLSAAVIGWLCQTYWSRAGVGHFALFNFLGGVLLLYPIGIAGISIVAGIPLLQAAIASLAFVPGDLVKVAVAAIVATTVRRSYPVMAGAH
ncbi:biotin transporter BioY [Oceanibacterium hippocampi]|uniref:Biotin transporter n=1 Tax=Oceanibacterium hippocampi TaxID=745714 RepID=A0A1Y5SXF5_9PROT|nr:biotin transporter BioY [Oceanibacterium hippocampi]SLN47375.1 Biotin transporter BioY [Oceanibacterium hippocampi]